MPRQKSNFYSKEASCHSSDMNMNNQKSTNFYSKEASYHSSDVNNGLKASL